MSPSPTSTRAAAERAAAELGGSAAAFAVDVTDEAVGRAAVRRRAPSGSAASTSATTTPASCCPTTPTRVATTLDTWNRLLAVNLTGVFLCMRHQIPHLLASGGGSIVNTASFVAVMGAATPQIAYSASKGGVLSMTPRGRGRLRPAAGSAATRSARARSTPAWSARS